MNKRAIYGLITLMSLGLIGIVSIQYIVIKNALELRKVQFKRSVMSAMVEITHQLQKEETLKRFDQLNMGRLDIISQTEDSLEFVYVDDGGIAITKKYMYNDSLFEEEIIHEVQPTHSKKVNFKDNIEVLVNSSPGEIRVSPPNSSKDSLLEKKLRRLEVKYDLYNEMIQELKTMDQSLVLSDRVDTVKVFKMLYDALAARGIEASFVYGISSENSESALYFGPSVENYIADISQSAYKTSMFPGEIYANETFLRVYFPRIKRDLLGAIGMLLFVSGLFITIIIVVFVVTLKIIFKQKRLSVIKNDFISNMTHELKTPISTISLACEALGDPSIDLSQDVRGNYLGMIKAENSRLGMLVEKVLRNAILEKGEVILNPEPTDLNELIRSTLTHFDLRIRKGGGQVIKDLSENLPHVMIDPIHTGNAISNLIDNAIKYARERPEIHLKTYADKNHVVVEVADNGIGISTENQKIIFEKFFRVPTGNVHNVKGFGLGLSYVSYVVENSGGEITVQSELGKGSTFIIKIPVYYEK